MAAVTRTLNNTEDPIVFPDGSPMAAGVLLFHLVDAVTLKPRSVFDAISGEFIGPGPLSVVLDSAGEFSTEIWPNGRGAENTYWRVTVYGITAKPIYIQITDAVAPITLAEAAAAVDTVSPSDAVALQLYMGQAAASALAAADSAAAAAVSAAEAEAAIDQITPTAQAIGDLIAGATEKTTLADSDKFSVMDSATGNVMAGVRYDQLLSLLRDSLDEIYNPIIPPEPYPTTPVMPDMDSSNVAYLFTGQSSEAPVAVSCAITADIVNFKYGTQAWKMTMASAVTAQMRLNQPSGVAFGAAGCIGSWIYVEDATKCTSITIEIALNSGLTTLWTRSFTPVTGWNFYRMQASAGTTSIWGTSYRVRINAVVNAATTVTVSTVWGEVRPKAQIILIEDGGYDALFYSGANGYADVRSRNIPIVWAVDPAKFAPTDAARINWVQLRDAFNNGDEVNYHGYDGAVTSTMTAEQIAADDLAARQLLNQHGYTIGPYRAAWVQNSAPNAAAVQNSMQWYATTSSTTGIICYPFPAPYKWDVFRTSVHGRTNANFDSYFGTLERTHGVMVFYVHGINNAGGTNATEAEWDYFLAKIDAGINAGWLEVVTFAQLMAG